MNYPTRPTAETIPKNDMLSLNFTVAEAVLSSTASRGHIDNTPNDSTIAVMMGAANKLERVRALLGNYPIHINSWYRSLLLNRAVGSKDTSQHIKGEAIDFICARYGSPLQICKAIVSHMDLIPFDQLILEHDWVHISFAILNGKPRGQVLSLLSNGAYANGLTDKLGNPVI